VAWNVKGDSKTTTYTQNWAWSGESLAINYGNIYNRYENGGG